MQGYGWPGSGGVLALLGQGQLDAHHRLRGAVVEGVVGHQLCPHRNEVPVVVQPELVDKLHDGAKVRRRQTDAELESNTLDVTWQTCDTNLSSSYFRNEGLFEVNGVESVERSGSLAVGCVGIGQDSLDLREELLGELVQLAVVLSAVENLKNMSLCSI